MPDYHSKRRTYKPERLPPAHGFAQRLVAMRGLLDKDLPAAGDQALKLLEEYLESLAHSYGYTGEGSLGKFAMFLRGRDGLAKELLDQIDTYTQVRNCLAHSYGLQTSPALAAEVIDFVGLLIKQGAVTAAQLMTRGVCVIAETEPLAQARDLMIRGGYGRLPVLRNGDGIVGLLIERDVVVAQALSEQSGKNMADLTVGDALPEHTSERIALVAPDTMREQVVDLLRRPGVVICLVTPHGNADERPIGIITHADLLYRM